jgi:hypothetical protein
MEVGREWWKRDAGVCRVAVSRDAVAEEGGRAVMSD